MSFITYLREAEKKEKAKKEKKEKDPAEAIIKGLEKDAKDALAKTPSCNPEDFIISGAATGKVVPAQPVADIQLTVGQQGNLEAYNVMRAFGINMENNLPSVTLLKQHPTPEIAQQAALLEKDIRAVIEYIMNMQIPL